MKNLFSTIFKTVMYILAAFEFLYVILGSLSFDAKFKEAIF